MASIINAATSGGLVTTADTSGILQLQTAGTTAVTVDASQNVSTTNGVTIQGLTVGRGAGAVSTNTVLGASAFQANTTGSTSVVVGNQAGYTNSTGINSVFVGHQAGYYATGNGNSFFGTGAGGAITTGIRNTIIGQYDGNGDGLDIRTASDYAVISDGAGNRLLSTANGKTLALDGGAVPQTGTGITFPATQSASTDANTLDDYEEGTWTPAQGSGLTVVGAYSSAGRYTKIGRSVTIEFSVAGATSVTLASTGQICSGVPFTYALLGYGTGGNGSGSVQLGCVLGGASSVYALQSSAASGSILYSLTYSI